MPEARNDYALQSRIHPIDNPNRSEDFFPDFRSSEFGHHSPGLGQVTDGFRLRQQHHSKPASCPWIIKCDVTDDLFQIT